MRRGFTFLETMLVLLVMGIVVMVAAPDRGAPVRETRMKAASDALDAAMQYAQLAAVSSGRPTRVVVDAAANSITVEQLRYAADLMDSTVVELAETALDSTRYVPVANPLKPDRVYRIDFDEEKELAGVDITASAFGPSTPVVYDAGGKASATGTVGIAVGGASATVTVGHDGVAGQIAF